MRFSSISARALPLFLASGLTLGAYQDGVAQGIEGRYAALPSVPYWWQPGRAQSIDLLPLVWVNDVDGAVLGAAGRAVVGDATVYLGLGLGTQGTGGQPAAIELAGAFRNGATSFRSVHGRLAFSLEYLPIVPRRADDLSLSVGVASTKLEDSRYLEDVLFFDCPGGAPSAPCVPVPTPYTWSSGTDNALRGGIAVGGGSWRAPWLRGSLLVGVKAFGGAHEYVRAEAESAVAGAFGPNDWWLRLAGGAATNRVPQQRRFLIEGADPVTRWLNPYIEARGALLQEAPYFVPGGPNLRAYEETRPLVKGYLALAAELSREVRSHSGFWGRATVFGEAAWTPGVPSTVGPADLNPGGDLLFDWQKLPDGEGSAQGQFRSSTLQVPALWADAGVGVTGGFERVALTLSFPVLASEPDFATAPAGGGERSALALRWNLSIRFIADDVSFLP